VVSQQGLALLGAQETQVNNVESILYPALMLLGGIALGFLVNALEERWDDWQDRRRKDKYGL
tara:strand:- start:477 stop:662 length:186 start_codon:yes stop_codon:yes gene_type:complete